MDFELAVECARVERQAAQDEVRKVVREARKVVKELAAEWDIQL